MQLQSNNQTPAQRKDEAKYRHKLAYECAIEHSCQLYVINEKKLYIELGFNSMTEYSKELWGYARSTMFGKLKIADRIWQSLGLTDTDVRVQFAGLLGKENENYLSSFLSLPSDKQSVLSALPQNEFDSLIQTGKTRIGSKQFTTNDFHEYSLDTIRALIKGKKRVQIKKTTEVKKNLPFKKVYANAEKYFTKLITELGKSDMISIEHKNEIDTYLREAIKIYDMYNLEKEQ